MLKITDEKLYSRDLASIENEKTDKIKSLNESILLLLFINFSFCMVCLYFLERFGIKFDKKTEIFSMIFVSLFLVSIEYYLILSRIQKKFGAKISGHKQVFSFQLSEYFYQTTNTEYVFFACKTIDNQIVIFYSNEIEKLDDLKDCFEIEIFEGQILSLRNFQKSIKPKLIEDSKEIKMNLKEIMENEYSSCIVYTGNLYF